MKEIFKKPNITDQNIILCTYSYKMFLTMNILSCILSWHLICCESNDFIGDLEITHLSAEMMLIIEDYTCEEDWVGPLPF